MLQCWYFYFSVYDDDDDDDGDNDDKHYPILTHKNPYMGFCAYGILGAPRDDDDAYDNYDEWYVFLDDYDLIWLFE